MGIIRLLWLISTKQSIVKEEQNQDEDDHSSYFLRLRNCSTMCLG